MRNLFAVIALMFAMLIAPQAHAGFGAFQGNQNLGLFEWIKCSTGLTCTKQGNYLNMVVSGVSGVVGLNVGSEYFATWRPDVVSSGSTATATHGISGDMYLSQVFVPFNARLTGVTFANADIATNNKYIVSIYNSSGQLLANSNSAGITSIGTYQYQSIPFSAAINVAGPAYYFLGLSVNGSTDDFWTLPSGVASFGLAGAAQNQVFGTLATSLTMPSGFVTSSGAVLSTY